MDGRGEAQTKAGKWEQTQGHLKKKISDLQRQIKQTAKDTIRYYSYSGTAGFDLSSDDIQCTFPLSV